MTAHVDESIIWTNMRTLPIIIFLTTLIVNSGVALAQSESRDREIAARYAPVFYQAIGDDPRSDYITNFDFDGDWRGDNNWAHVANRRFPLKAFIYYSVSETQTHYFIYYAVFHARDYKGGTTKGKILSELIREGTNRIKGFDPTGMASEATVAHENDMEGCLVVVEKDRSPSQSRIVYVETLAHNKFLKYAASSAGDEGLSFDGQHPLLYIEPKGHGIQHYVSDETTEDRESNNQEKGNNKDEARQHKSSAKNEGDSHPITTKFR